MTANADFIKKASKSKTKTANYEGTYDADKDEINIKISNVSESFVPSKSSDNEVIHYDIDLMSSLKASGNIILT